MPTTNAEARREAIGIMVAARAESADDANALARATIDTWREVTAQAAPVIGAGGVDVLLSRAIHQTGSVFPWLAAAADDRPGSALLATLQARFAGQDRAAIEAASAALLLNFAELLATLIGESLTDRLLGSVWTRATPASGRETP